jgi:hypothetical protein
MVNEGILPPKRQCWLDSPVPTTLRSGNQIIHRRPIQNPQEAVHGTTLATLAEDLRADEAPKSCHILLFCSLRRPVHQNSLLSGIMPSVLSINFAELDEDHPATGSESVTGQRAMDLARKISPAKAVIDVSMCRVPRAIFSLLVQSLRDWH